MNNLIQFIKKRNLTIVLIAFLIFFIVVSVIFNSFFSSMRANAIRIGEKTVEASVEELNGFLSEQTDMLMMTVQSVSYMLNHHAETQEILTYLEEIAAGYEKTHDQEFNGFYGTIRGAFFESSGWRPEEGFVAEERPWYQTALRGGGTPTVSSPYYDVMSGQTMVAIGCLLPDGRSVISTDVGLERLLEMTERKDGDENSHYLILDRNGYVVASRSEDLIGKNLLDGQGPERMQELARSIYGKESATLEMTLYGGKNIIYSKMADDGWYVVLTMNENILYSGIVRDFMIFFLASLVLLVMILYICDTANQKRLAAEALTDQLTSAASIYLAMYQVDLKTDTYETVKGAEYIQKLVGDRDLHATDLMALGADALVNEVYREDFLQFMNPGTLDERLKVAKTVSFEFLGNTTGWCRCRYIAVDREVDGSLHHVLWALENIDKEKRESNRLLYLSETDLMTGLRNRGSGEKKITALLHAKPSGCFFLLDVDKFKFVNDNYGHAIGDKVLIALADAMKASFRESDILVRMGGDEFGAFAGSVEDMSVARELIKRFFQRVERIDIPELGAHQVTVSVGAVLVRKGERKTFDAIYHEADTGTYESKKVRGNAYTFYSP